MLWGCFAAGGTGARHKIDGITRKENYVEILKQHLKRSVRKLKLGHKWIFQTDNDPKHTSKVEWLKDNKVKVLKWPSQSPDLKSYRTFVGRTEKSFCEQGGLQPDSVTTALSGGMGQNSPNLLWEACERLPETFDPS